MKSNLKDIYSLQQFLLDIEYPDYKRISLEISKYLDSNPHIDINDIKERLQKGEPWEYIRGYTQFCNLDFLVTINTLIPRIETEQIVYNAATIIKEEDITTLIDVGTGTGCIPISISSILGDSYSLSIYGTDISKKALDVAKRNELNILKKKGINWICTNLIKDIPSYDKNCILIANLPYIPTQQYLHLDKSVLNYEPRLALDGGEDGLKYFKELFTMIKDREYLPKYIYLETEESIYTNTFELIKQHFKDSLITKEKDCFNRDRFLKIIN